MGHSILTDRQWRWIGDRWLEGYTMAELADFVGMNPESIRRGLIRLGIRPHEKQTLIPLYERETEYKQLERKGCRPDNRTP